MCSHNRAFRGHWWSIACSARSIGFGGHDGFFGRRRCTIGSTTGRHFGSARRIRSEPAGAGFGRFASGRRKRSRHERSLRRSRESARGGSFCRTASFDGRRAGISFSAWSPALFGGGSVGRGTSIRRRGGSWRAARRICAFSGGGSFGSCRKTCRSLAAPRSYSRGFAARNVAHLAPCRCAFGQRRLGRCNAAFTALTREYPNTPCVGEMWIEMKRSSW